MFDLFLGRGRTIFYAHTWPAWNCGELAWSVSPLKPQTSSSLSFYLKLFVWNCFRIGLRFQAPSIPADKPFTYRPEPWSNLPFLYEICPRLDVTRSPSCRVPSSFAISVRWGSDLWPFPRLWYTGFFFNSCQVLNIYDSDYWQLLYVLFKPVLFDYFLHILPPQV